MLVQETGQGLENANSYASVQQVKDYCSIRRIDIIGKSDDEIAGAAIVGTDWIDANFSRQVTGSQQFTVQALQWPRTGLVDGAGVLRPLGYMPPQVIKATCILAVEALKGTLWTNVSPSNPQIIEDTTGPLTTKYNPINPRDMVVQRNFDEVRATLAPLLRSFGLLTVTR